MWPRSSCLTVPSPKRLIDSAIRISCSLGRGKPLLHTFHPSAERLTSSGVFLRSRVRGRPLQIATSSTVVGAPTLLRQTSFRVLVFPSKLEVLACFVFQCHITFQS